MVTVTSAPGLTLLGEKEREAGPAGIWTVTLEAPPAVWSFLSESLSSPEKS